MNKFELAESLVEKTEGMSKEAYNKELQKYNKLVGILFDSIKESLLRGDKVEIRGFGTFNIKHYDSYTGRNPKTGEIIEVKKKRLPVFKASNHLKKSVNGETENPDA